MLIESSVRQPGEIVEISHVGGIGKARKLLRLARDIRKKTKHLGALCIRLAHNGEWVRANRFRQAFERLSELHDDLREKARIALRQPSELAYDAKPTPTPFTSLSVQEARK